MKICVLGGGIIGVSSALRIIKEQDGKMNLSVTLMSDEFSPNTTGDGSAGFWWPYLMQNTPIKDQKQWCADTFQLIEERFCNHPDPNSIGLNLISGYELQYTVPQERPYWANIVYGFRNMEERELMRYDGAKHGWSYTTFTIECPKYLPYLMDQFQRWGGCVIKRKVTDLYSLLPEFDIVLNCTGMGAKELTNDANLKPIRGQVIRVSAPNIKHFVHVNDKDFLGHYSAYILPNAESVVLGGTHQASSDTRVSQDDRQNILAAVSRLEKSLSSASAVKDWVGLRPGRNKVRLEIDKSSGGRIVHNYGHGGAGVTIHWGCAGQAASLVRECMSQAWRTSSRL